MVFPTFVQKTLDIANMLCWSMRLPEGEYLTRAKESVAPYLSWDQFLELRQLPEPEVENRIVMLVLG